MRTIVHLSDLHFGRVDPATLGPLQKVVRSCRPTCVVVSGDLTQRARATEFQQARAFLDGLPGAHVVVPGNHDVPLYRVWERLVDPLRNYRRFIAPVVEPFFVDAEVAVVGINTARSLTFKNGRINAQQIERIRRRFLLLPPEIVRIVVTHHPFDLHDQGSHGELVGRAEQAMAAFSLCGVDLLLAGHFHVGTAGDTATRYALGGYAALAVQAGTATSTRSRGETNSFNVLRIGGKTIAVDRYSWSPTELQFARTGTEEFRREGARWTEA